MPGVTEQEAPSIGKLGNQPTVHAERGRPGDFPHPDSLPDPSLEHRGHRAGPRITGQPPGLALVEVPHEGEPVSAGQRHEQDLAFRARDQCPAVARQAAFMIPLATSEVPG